MEQFKVGDIAIMTKEHVFTLFPSRDGVRDLQYDSLYVTCPVGTKVVFSDVHCIGVAKILSGPTESFAKGMLIRLIDESRFRELGFKLASNENTLGNFPKKDKEVV